MATEPETGAKQSLTVEEEMEMIRTSPIADVAAYFGGDLELAVQLRVDSAVEDTFDKLASRHMDISVRPITPQGNLHGFASVTISGIRIDDFKIVEKKDGELFVGLPSKPDKTSNTGYRNTVHIEKGYKTAFDYAVIRKYYEAAAQAKERAANLRPAPEKPERMADRVAKAQKEADKHNAALPPKEKSTKTRTDRE